MFQRPFLCLHLCLINLLSPGLAIMPLGRQIAEQNKNNHNNAITRTKNDYSADASSLFVNIRVPASLFAGASAAAAFALPMKAHEGVTLGLVKRLYSTLMIASLCSQIITLVVSTTTITLIAVNHERNTNVCTLDERNKEVFSLGQFLNQSYELEWTTMRLFFSSGLLLFSIAAGLRAWVTFACPVVARAMLGFVISAIIYSLGFIQRVESKIGAQSDLHKNIIHLPFRFFAIIVRNTFQAPSFAVATIIALLSLTYVLINIPMIVRHLEAGN